MRRLMSGALLCWVLLALSACGSGATPDSGAANPNAQPAPAPIKRRAECALPEWMQVGRPATVRFSIYNSGNQPNDLPGTSATTEPLNLPQRPGLETWVAVSLTVNGVTVPQEEARRYQRLSEGSNIWVWQITTNDPQPVVIQPIVDVEYRDAQGQVIAAQPDVWTQTYTVNNVAGSSYLNVAGAWLGDSINELVAGAIGTLIMTYVIIPTRNALGRRVRRRSDQSNDDAA